MKLHARQMSRREFVAGSAAITATLLTACGSDAKEQESTEGKADAGQVDTGQTDAGQVDADSTDASGGGRILVAFFSRADENYAGGSREWLEVGHTKVMAGYLADALGADQYEIVPAEPYPEGYDECCDVALEEQGEDARPALANDLPNVSDYDTVFVGCPIWWGDEPMIVRTFIEGVDLSGKTIVPFTTHGGSGLGNVPASLQSRIPNASFLDGYAVAGTAVDGARGEVTDWAQGLGIA